MLKKIKKILKIIILLLAIFIIIINVTLIVKAKRNEDVIPDFFGFTPFIIVSGSMEPKIQTNNIIITKKVKNQNIKVGDIISYKSADEDIIITHRVVNIIEQNGQTYYQTKGDSNKSNDKNLVAPTQIQGIYLCSIPIIGNLITYIKTPEGLGLVLTFVICVYILYDIYARETMRNKHKRKVKV